MRQRLLVIGGLAFSAGCFAPFSWPEDRQPSAPHSAAAPLEVAAATPVPPKHLEPAPDALAQAAACLDRGDEAGALPHLRAHVAAYPDAVMMRAYLAELLLKLGQPTEARIEFERVVANAADSTGPAGKHLVHCHTRLMEIAQATDDPVAEELHRGIGLVLLVRQWAADPASRDYEMEQRTLSRAAAALRSAQTLDPSDPRPAIFLSESYARLGQSSAARTQSRTAESLRPDLAFQETNHQPTGQVVDYSRLR